MSRKPLEENDGWLVSRPALPPRREQFRQGNVQDFGDSSQQQNGDVSFAGFQLGQMPFRNVGFLCTILRVMRGDCEAPERACRRRAETHAREWERRAAKRQTWKRRWSRWPWYER